MFFERHGDFMKLNELVELNVGSPQFRIKNSVITTDPEYKFYSQNDLEEDLAGMKLFDEQPKLIRTSDNVTTLAEKDVVFSLISGKAAIVSPLHSGYLYTQNYIVIKTGKKIDDKFLVYLLNEDKQIARQLWLSLQGSSVLKYTVKQLRELKIAELPPIDKQKIIGDIYMKQCHLQALQERKARNETLLRLTRLGEAY